MVDNFPEATVAPEQFVVDNCLGGINKWNGMKTRLAGLAGNIVHLYGHGGLCERVLFEISNGFQVYRGMQGS